jgi:uncharacterized protein
MGRHSAVRGSLARRLVRLHRSTVLGSTVPVARGWRARLLGLALLSREQAGPGLLIPRCRSVHTFGMRFELEVVFLGARGEVLARHPRVRPGRILLFAGATDVLERPAA